ncbi:MAG: adenylate/guanylate cyclase domain-containing protein [Solirubrobacterales bacterium]
MSESERRSGDRLSGRQLIWRASVPLTVGVVGSNLVGTATLFALVAWVIPVPNFGDDASTIRTVNILTLAAYLTFAITFGMLRSVKDMRPVIAWLKADRPPTAEEQALALLGPERLFGRLTASWGVGVVIFVTLNFFYSARLALVVGIAGVLSGLATCAFSYLVCERVTRDIARRALEEGPSDHPEVPGVTTRVMLVWALTTGAPVLGVILIAAGVVLGILPPNYHQLGYSAMFVCLAALVFGVQAMFLVSRSIADPIKSVRLGVARVGAGDFDVSVPVFDASEVGLLQSGFNDMVAGLRERERLRDIFGRHVGEDVAAQALDAGAELGGEVRDVAVLFIDLVGSTELASTRPPHEVVELLNRFFGVVVEVVGAHGGSINKFEGDAALCIFGAPVARDDAAGDALAAARRLASELRERVPELSAGIGVSGGPAVAGNIGAAERFEYTVIGDPVNEAARLTEAAKGVPGLLVASERVVTAAREAERSRWKLGESLQLRGRNEPTRLATPA